MSLDGFSMHALVKELSRALVGGRIDKIAQLAFKGTTTAFVGDFANFVVGCSFVPAHICNCALYISVQKKPTDLHGCRLLYKETNSRRAGYNVSGRLCPDINLAKTP